MSGILAGIKLREAGHDFTIFEKAASVGGTWRDNTYPGIACDVPSHIYSFSFDLNPEWTYLSSPGAEVLAYFEDVTRRYELDAHIRFNDAVTDVVWDTNASELGWELTTAAGHHERFDFIVAATGILHHPKRPDIEGLDSFEGPLFHSAQWDHEVEVDHKRVALIGTGSSGVQITGALAPRVESLSVFMRTAQWVVPVDQVEYTEEEKQVWRTDADALEKLHLEMAKGFNEGFGTEILDANSGMTDRIEGECMAALAKLPDDLRAKLTPDYRPGCKRLVVSHNFYDAVQNPATTIVKDGIERIEPTGVRTTDGELHEVDVVVLATGFQVDRFMRPMNVVGRNDRTLDEVWSERPTAYLSVAVPEFPNFFMLNGPNSPVGNFSLIQTAEMQMDYVMQLVELVTNGQLEHAVVTEDAAQRFDDERVGAAQNTVWATGCNSWYLDDRGIPFAWPFPFSRFESEMSEPKLGDYELAH
jgi:cation diffusion facilitator CzcD-associated flavoprotein CzcO